MRTKKLILNSHSRVLKNALSKNKFTCLKTKLLIYKILLKSIWIYELKIWSTAKKTNLNKIQVYQNSTLRKITNALPYMSNQTLHNDMHNHP